MSRICPKCGEKTKSGSGACPACGHVPEDDVQIYTPRANIPLKPQNPQARPGVSLQACCARF